MGYHGDCADTFAAGKISAEAQKLIEVTRQSFYEGIKLAREGQRVSDISHAVQEYVQMDSICTRCDDRRELSVNVGDKWLILLPIYSKS